MIERKYKEKIASIINSSQDHIFLYWKGRVALYAFLKAAGIKEDDEIIIPGFTCVVVPNAIIYSGAKPVYIDISPDNYNVDISKMEKSITSRTKVIICQNTFGLSSNVEKIVEIARRDNIYTIEDCTHGFGGYYNGKPNGSYCDAAFFSTQWNKPFSTGIGGFLVINNITFLDKLKYLEKEKIKPNFNDQFILSFLIFFRKFFINDSTYDILVKFFRYLSKHNLIIGSNRGDELNSNILSKEYFKDISPTQIWAGLRSLKKIDQLNLLRKKNARSYTRFLKENNKTFVKEELFDNHLFLKYPLLVKNKELFFKLAIKSRIVLGDWFVSPLHPIKSNFQLWGFNEEKCPVAVSISQKIVNLPTDINYNSKVLKFLNKNLDLIT